MSNFLFFELLSYFLLPISFTDTETSYNLFKCDIVISHSSFGESKEMEGWRAFSGS
jgi:hypothetical protein